jgi:Rap1a immunity proteins
MLALGFVLGVTQMLEMNEQTCPPAEVTNAQFAAVVRKWLEGHPNVWSDPALYGVMAAARITFPCQKK